MNLLFGKRSKKADKKTVQSVKASGGSHNRTVESIRGFSLIEATIAILMLTIAVIGVFSVFTYATVFNTGNSNRSQALAVLQTECEKIRSAKFTPQVTSASLQGGIRPVQTVTSQDGTRFQVKVTVDDDYTDSGVQIYNSSSIKEITIQIIPEPSIFKWQTSVPAYTVMRRVRSN